MIETQGEDFSLAKKEWQMLSDMNIELSLSCKDDRVLRRPVDVEER